MDSVFFIKVHGVEKLYLWQKPFLPKVQTLLISFANPTGTITNSDLELYGNVAHHNVITSQADVRIHTIWTGSDNIANVYWHRKGLTMTTRPTAYLLRDQALHQWTHRYAPLHDYIPGATNAMTDDYSYLWHLTDSQFLCYFNCQYPQCELWQICRLSDEWFLKVLSSLYRRPLLTASLQRLQRPRKDIGRSGAPFAATSTLTRGQAFGQLYCDGIISASG